MAQKPLMLKDYLELDSCSDSCSAATLQRAKGTTVRLLLETELGGGADQSGWRLVRSRSKNALTRFSMVMRLLNFTTDGEPVTVSGPAHLITRSFSKKLRRSFWKKRVYEKEDKGNVMANDIERLNSFGGEGLERGSLFYPSPVVSSFTSSSDTLSSAESSELFVNGKDSMPRSPIAWFNQNPEKGDIVGVGDESRRPSTGSQEPEEHAICGKDMDCPSEEEKEQFSPVSVMEFPYHDEVEDLAAEQPSPTSPSFEQSIVNIERTKNQLLQKIQRFESLASLDPVDLDHCFACTQLNADTTVHGVEEYENEARHYTASSLLRQLAGGDRLSACAGKLLYDFFVEGLSFTEDGQQGTKGGSASKVELLRLASGWVAGGGTTVECDDMAAFREVDRYGRGWRSNKEEEEVVAVEMTGGMVTWLLEELVDDLLVSVA